MCTSWKVKSEKNILLSVTRHCYHYCYLQVLLLVLLLASFAFTFFTDIYRFEGKEFLFLIVYAKRDDVPCEKKCTGKKSVHADSNFRCFALWSHLKGLVFYCKENCLTFNLGFFYSPTQVHGWQLDVNTQLLSSCSSSDIHRKKLCINWL